MSAPLLKFTMRFFRGSEKAVDILTAHKENGSEYTKTILKALLKLGMPRGK